MSTEFELLDEEGVSLIGKNISPQTFEEIIFFPSTGECILLLPEELKELETYADKLDGAIKEFTEVKESIKPIAKNLSEEEAEAQYKKNEEILINANKKLNDALLEVSKEEKKDTPAALVVGNNSKTLMEGLAFGRKKTVMAPSFFIDRIRRSEDNHSRNTYALIPAPPSAPDPQADVYAPFRNDEGELDISKIKKAFNDNVKKGVKTTWNLYKKEGQISSETLALIVSPTIANFLKSEDYEAFDKWVANFNEEHGKSKGRKEKKKDKIIALLNLDDLSVEDAEKAIQLIDDVWDKSDKLADIKKPDSSKYGDEITAKVIEEEEDEQEELLRRVKEAEVPPVWWDYSSGAQLMRYSLTAGLDFDFDLKEKGKLTAQINAGADFALAEGKADIDAYIPDTAGFNMAFTATVRKQKIKWTPTETDGDKVKCYYHFNSDLVTVSSLYNACAYLATRDKVSVNTYLFQIVGHADKPGTDSRNQELSEKRAQSMYAFLTSDNHKLYNFFQTHWNIEEKQYMLAAIYFMVADSYAFQTEFLEKGPVGTLAEFNANITKHTLFNRVQDSDERKKILLGKYYYDAPQTENKRLLVSLDDIMKIERFNPYTASERNSSEIYNPINIIHQFKDPIFEGVNIALAYRSKLLNHFENTYGIKDIEKKQFFVHPEDLPYQHFETTLGKGETEPAINTTGKDYRNRRTVFTSYRIDDSEIIYTKDDTKIDLGVMRLLLQGYASAWAGANITVAAGIDITCPRGNMEMRGLAGAEAEAIVGVKAELGIKADLEWKNPTAKEKKFNMLGSVGYSVTGILGGSAAAEFKIGFDQDSKRFQIKMKAQAAWGLGVGGSFSFTVGLNDLFDFVCLVHDQLLKQDFCFVDIFETVIDESGTDVFPIFNAMCTTLLVTGHPLTAGGLYVATRKENLKAAATFLDDWGRKTDAWKKNRQKEDNLDKLAETIKNEPEFIKKLTPETKGRILYLLCTVKPQSNLVEKFFDSLDGDLNDDYEDAAQKLIIHGILTKRDWQETLEHMAEANTSNAYVSTVDKKNRDNYSEKEMSERITRVNKNKDWLQHSLFGNEPKKWRKIEIWTSRLK